MRRQIVPFRQVKAICLSLLLALTSVSALGAELDLNLNDDAARLTYAWDLESNDLRIDTGWLHHQDRGDVIHVGLHLNGEASNGANPVVGGLGGKLFFINADQFNSDVAVLGVGGFLRFTMPDYNRFSLYAHLYFAPDVLAFGDGKGYSEVEARMSYNVLREADLYLGVRHSEVKLDGFGTRKMDNGLHAGIQLRF